MKAWQIDGAYGIEQLKVAEKPDPKPGPGQIVVAMRAASLNYRDLMTVKGVAGDFPLPLVPFSDGAGEIVAIGDGVTDVSLGDRVCPLFSHALGQSVPGVLQEKMLIEAEQVAKFPAHLSFEEAATLPCAGLTAWRAVSVEAPVRPGDTVLVQGTGGVSIFALQFAKARGARVIVTSSSDAKLERARALGADETINYKATPDWSTRARELTSCKGVDVVVEVGGENTFNQSLDAARVFGAIVVIGVLGGVSAPVMLPVLFTKNLRVFGISVGSGEQFDGMCADIERWALKPVIDRTFAFDDVPKALRLMEGRGHFGKIAVRF